MAKEIECSQDNCKSLAAFKYYWMSEKKYACVEHIQTAVNIGLALGLYLTPELLDDFGVDKETYIIFDDPIEDDDEDEETKDDWNEV